MAKNKSNHRTSKYVGTMVDNLASGYAINVKPLPPYYVDLVEDRFPFQEFPKRKIRLTSGDIINWPYEPPDTPPDEGDPDHDLYISWKSAEIENEVVKERRKRAKRDFLLANCIEVVSGPERLDDVGWTERVEASFDGWKVPTHPGQRLLIFIKTQVVLHSHEMELILSLCTSPEVTMQGILNALQGFRVDVGEGEHIPGDNQTAEQ